MRPTCSLDARPHRACTASTRSRLGVATCTMHGVVRIEPAVSASSSPNGLQPHVDALGVVQPVHAEQQTVAGSPRSARICRGALRGRPAPASCSKRGGVDGDRERADPDRCGRPPRPAGPVPSPTAPWTSGPSSRRASHRKFCAPTGQLEADQVGAEQPPHDLRAPRQLHEQLHRRERDVQEEADPQVRPQLAQHRGHQLQLVVLHPHRRPAAALLGGSISEPLVDLDVRVPPIPLGTPAATITSW